MEGKRVVLGEGLGFGVWGLGFRRERGVVGGSEALALGLRRAVLYWGGA